ncbi:hypothetical protein PCASD_09651 [Puccinia coronata f. sp. avenae]|uniref:CHCH domain-containing protein n=1 Tax=Puccinia coronata f. sp. avenae TaxID=200324 RepID=A0A2N5UHY1_9BASI|nr:hypothetical protein PCASD_09651 [Puccinia coronata f. sp. avenae]
MPRRSSSSGGNRSSTRSASTTTHQPVQARPPAPPATQNSSVPATHQPTSSGPGLFGQMASTAAGVAVGHTMGQGLSNMLFGGGSKEEAPVAAPQPKAFDEPQMGGQCETAAKDFTRCLESTKNDMNSCSYYLEQLKACQNMFQQTHRGHGLAIAANDPVNLAQWMPPRLEPISQATPNGLNPP